MQSPESLCIALVEDDPIMGESLVQRLSLEGYETIWWQTGREAVEALRKRRPDLVVCDIRLPDMNGEAVFHDSLGELSTSPVLFITAYGDIDQAVRLIRAGADDYLTKPFSMDAFLDRIQHLLRRRPAADGPAVLGTSAAMRAVEALLRRVADIDSTLLITGESGVGKEVAARLVHGVSRRAGRPFVAVNCAAIPESLIESEMFGHEKGAFTGAGSRHEGYAERARDGILFLDEVAELPPAMQAKLLRLIQERSFQRVGGERPVAFRARILCASNRDMEAAVAEGRFRADLYYRINVIPVALPPLRERPEDIPPLLRRFIEEFAVAFGSPARAATTTAEAVALSHGWPGNVRELRNRIERAVALATRPWLSAPEIFPDLRLMAEAEESGTDDIASLSAAREAAERRHILAALERTQGQIGRAASLLAVSRTTLWEKMRKLGLVDSV